MSQNTAYKKALIAGLDIGTTKVVFSIGLIGANEVEIIGVGTAPSIGMKQGVVVNIEATAETITSAREEAELMAGMEISDVWLSMCGSHIESFDSSGMVAIHNNEVNQEDISRVIETAKAIAIPTDQQMIHVLPCSYKIDQQGGILDPIGMSGVRLEANVHIVTGKKSAIQNTIKCVEKAGLSVNGLVLQQLAGSKAILSEDEKNLGVSVVDIGGGTCDLITYLDGCVVHTGTLPVGGNNFSHDVAMGLRTTQLNAESLKKKYGSVLPDTVTEEEVIDVESVGEVESRSISRKQLCQILEARAEEVLSMIRGELVDHNLISKLGSGLVITGGESQLLGFIELGNFILDLPVRRGTPKKVGGLTDVVRGSEYATVVGLLLYGAEKQREYKTSKLKSFESNVSETFSQWAQKIKTIVAGTTD